MRLQTSEAELARVLPDANRNVAELEVLRSELAIMSTRRKQLEMTLIELAARVQSIEQEFYGYRDTYRRNVRRNAVGRSMGDWTLKDGRQYKNVYIVEVTDVGIEIRHDEGTSRIRAVDLDVGMQDQFQWSDEESKRKILEENALSMSLDVVSGKPASVASIKERSDAEVTPATGLPMQDESMIRQRIRDLQQRVSQLESEHFDAQRNANTKTRIAGPGGLETWREKAGRLAGDLALTRGELAAARLELSIQRPKDSRISGDLMED